MDYGQPVLNQKFNNAAAALPPPPPGAVGMSTPAASSRSSGLSATSVNLSNMRHVGAETWGRVQALSNKATGYKVGNNPEMNAARAITASKWAKLNANARKTWETITLPAEYSKSMRYANRFLGSLGGAWASPEDFERHKRDCFAWAFDNKVAFDTYHESVGKVTKQSIPNQKWANDGFPIEFLYCDFAKSADLQDRYCKKARAPAFPQTYPPLAQIDLRDQFPARFATVAALNNPVLLGGGNRVPVQYKSKKRSNRRQNRTRRR